MTQNIDSYFEDGKGYHSNPFRKGYLTDEERKQPFRWFGENFVFFAKNADLYSGIEIYANPNYTYPCPKSPAWNEALIRDCITFGLWWRMNVHQYLNGFSGLDNVKVEIDPKLNMNLDIKL
jgi:hypothetical protein